ncbi:MAG: NAD(P)H-binding protein [Myxococcales bacterium]|nr:NAD(P)H-binding protein [Myxococcales bacterium]
MSSAQRQSVVVAGAAGFVGAPLIEQLRRRFAVIALSRSARDDTREHVSWRRVDLMSLREARAAVRGADYAVYLVHSMMPADRLVQGGFDEIDLLVADNFARACAEAGVRQIVYLGGLLPEHTTGGEALSAHLRSRAEVERALAAYGTPVTVLRAGLVIGRNGSSTEMLVRLVQRLPVMVCPRWTDVDTQPVALSDVAQLLDWCVGRDETRDQVFDIGGPDVLTYRELMVLCGELLGRPPRTYGVPVLTPTLSRLWVSLITGAPKALVAPLIGSLAHRMVARDRRLQEAAAVAGRTVRDALQEALSQRGEQTPRAFRALRRGERSPYVRAIYRMGGGHAPRALAERYVRWLDERLAPLVRCHISAGGERIGFDLLGIERLRLIEMRRDDAGSDPERAAYDITRGLLVGGSRGRFELRAVGGGEEALCVISDFEPALWWPLYVATQAQAHHVVMRAFAASLARSRLEASPERLGA